MSKHGGKQTWWGEVGDYVSLGEGSEDNSHNNSNGSHSNEYFLRTLDVPDPELSTLILTVIMQENLLSLPHR